MTDHYARITDQTVRRRWEAAMKVTIKGERVALAADGPLGQAQWAKSRYGIAAQILPTAIAGCPARSPARMRMPHSLNGPWS